MTPQLQAQSNFLGIKNFTRLHQVHMQIAKCSFMSLTCFTTIKHKYSRFHLDAFKINVDNGCDCDKVVLHLGSFQNNKNV